MAKMRSEKVSESRRRANDKFDAKTYRRITFVLRVQEDADIIEDLESAKKNGMSMRAWLRKIFED